MGAETGECCYCGRPILRGQRASRLPRGRLAIHMGCLERDTVADGHPPGDESVAKAA